MNWLEFRLIFYNFDFLASIFFLIILYILKNKPYFDENTVFLD